MDILQLPIEVQTFCSKKTPELVAASLLPACAVVEAILWQPTKTSAPDAQTHALML